MQNYEPDTPSKLELIGIDGAPMLKGDGSPMTISLLGDDSEVAVRARHTTTDLRIQQSQRGATLTAAALDAADASYFAKLTTAWDIEFGGEVAEFSADAARKLYADRKTSFVLDQVREHVKKRANFLR